MTVFIFTNGTYKNPIFYKKQLKKEDYIIAADGGANFLKKIEIYPQLILGDMDSIEKETLSFFKGIEIRQFPKEKDETDTELAIDFAIDVAKKYKINEVVVFGALGSRMDHSLGNIYLLTRFLEAGLLGSIIDENNEIFLIKKEKILNLKPGSLVSLLPIGGDALEIRIKGFKYPIENKKMTLKNPYGISNCVLDKKQEIRVGKGLLLAIISKD